MKDRSGDGCLIVFGLLLVSLMFGFWCGAKMGKWHGMHVMQSEAVQRGFAEWVVDSQGNTEWKWKE